MDQTNRRCTAEFRQGEFCDDPSIPEAPFPICARHAIAVHLAVLDYTRSELADPQRAVGLAERLREQDQDRRLAAYDRMDGPYRVWIRGRGKSQVYYLRLNDLIKIGTSVDIKSRMNGYPPGAILLALEPGGFEVESGRHKQFRAARAHRQEWFHPTPELMQHIKDLAITNGGIAAVDVTSNACT